MIELKDTILETVVGGHWGAVTYVKNVNNSFIKLSDFSVSGSGGLTILVTQTIG